MTCLMYVADHIPLYHLVVLKEDLSAFPNLVLKLKAKVSKSFISLRDYPVFIPY